MASFTIEVQHVVNNVLSWDDTGFFFPLDCDLDGEYVVALSGQRKIEVSNANYWVYFYHFKPKCRMKAKFYFFDQSADVNTVEKAFFAEFDVSGPFVAIVISYFYRLRI